MAEPTDVEALRVEVVELRSRLAALEVHRAPPSRRRLVRPSWVAGSAVVVLLGSALAYAQVTCSQPLAGLGLVSFCNGNPARAAEVNSNTETLVNLIQAKVGALTTGAASSQPITAARMNLGGGVATASHLTGGNASGNIHIDGTGSGGVYLNWYTGRFTIFGNGAQGEVGRLDNQGNLTLSGTLNGRYPVQVVSNSCSGGSNVSCTAICPNGRVIKQAWGFHGGNGMTSDFGLAAGVCGSNTQWKGTCINQTACTVTTGCNAASIVLECW